MLISGMNSSIPKKPLSRLYFKFMIEQLGLPDIEIKYGGPALLSELYNDSLELRDKINEIIIALNKLESN